jgi:histone demethylase JARID1
MYEVSCLFQHFTSVCTSHCQLPMGRECVEHYRLLKRQCVFSHDELVCKMASLPIGSLALSQAQMAYHDLLAMVNEEKKLRKLLLTKACVAACTICSCVVHELKEI